jgi:hypothetical protein
LRGGAVERILSEDRRGSEDQEQKDPPNHPASLPDHRARMFTPPLWVMARIFGPPAPSVVVM